jgi:hypothetical protein
MRVAISGFVFGFIGFGISALELLDEPTNTLAGLPNQLKRPHYAA